MNVTSAIVSITMPAIQLRWAGVRRLGALLAGRRRVVRARVDLAERARDELPRDVDVRRVPVERAAVGRLVIAGASCW
ncbi:MAG: hypothetical protein GXY68_02630 [Chloroflexi bacterium]|nr:hypothetical protein [Chloroflexota bacterium]